MSVKKKPFDSYIRNEEMEFLHPRSRQFPFDAVCEMIIRELEKRNWKVHGIDVEFDEYGTGEQKFRLVRAIKGTEFRLHFGRPQGLLAGGKWNDTAAVTELAIPRKEIHVFDDESGPTSYLYTGKNWEADRKGFFDGSKVLSKLYKKPKTYLEYKGGFEMPIVLINRELDLDEVVFASKVPEEQLA